MYVNTKTRLVCDLMGPKIAASIRGRLLFKCGFFTQAFTVADVSML